MTVTEKKRRKNRLEPVGRWIRPDLRLAIYLRDGFECMYCGTDLHGARPRDVTLDHLVPTCRGGSNSPHNLITACRRCNSARAHRKWKEYAGNGFTIEKIICARRRKIARFRKLARALLAEEKNPFEEYERASFGMYGDALVLDPVL